MSVNNKENPCFIALANIHAKANTVLSSIKEVVRVYSTSALINYINNVTLEVITKAKARATEEASTSRGVLPLELILRRLSST